MSDPVARWPQVKALCQAALGHEPHARAAFLASACGNDEALRCEVESLLAHSHSADGFLSEPPGAVAAGVLGADISLGGRGTGGDLIGRRLGSYQVVAALGKGGMGEVYRARDTRLGRDVAIKVLPESFVHDADRVARFRREAQMLASLNHPHIAAIYGLEEGPSTGPGHPGGQFLVLELIEGNTLAHRLGAGAMPFDEALSVAAQIADALAAAHDKGIVHRDLKPANIALTADGNVKVLDFGLAKATGPGSSGDLMNSPTLTSPALATGAGVILGTAGYMSPEQSKGREADKRSDLWAFGCVLYEMLTGKPAFEGEDVLDRLTATMRGEPDWTALPVDTPAQVRMLLERCLKKDRKERLSDIAVAQFLLDSPPTPASAVPVASPSAWRSAAALALTGLLGAALATGVMWIRRPALSVTPLTRFSTALPAGQVLAGNGVRQVAISPDGTRFVYTTNEQLYVRAADQLEPVPIRGTDEQPAGPFFSPDGLWIGYWANGQLKKIAAAGGTPVPLCDTDVPLGVSWEGDRIVFATRDKGISEVPANGGVPRILIAAEPKVWFHDPYWVPGADAIVFAVRSDEIRSRWDDSEIVVQSLKTGARNTLVADAFSGRVLPTGHLVYVRDNVLLARSFDLSRLELTGGPVALVEGVSQALAVYVAGVHFDVSRTGTLVYLKGGFSELRTLVWRDRQGQETPIPAPPRAYGPLRISPDGTRIAFDMSDRDNGIWIWDIARESMTRLTRDGEVGPIWSHDSRRIIYSSADSLQMLWRPADGNGAPEVLATSTKQLQASTVTPDGRQLVFWPQGQDNDLMIMNLTGDRTPRLLPPKTPFFERHPALSPDGRWIAFATSELESRTVFVRPFPDTGKARWQLSSGAGSRPVWAPNGRELYYVSPRGELMAVAVQTTPGFVAGKPTVLFGGVDLRFVNRPFDIAPDGKRFVFPKNVESASQAQFVVIQNWFKELKARVPTQ